MGLSRRQVRRAKPIVRFIERVYNDKHLHSAPGFRPPAEFEQVLLAQNHAAEVASRSSL